MQSYALILQRACDTAHIWHSSTGCRWDMCAHQARWHVRKRQSTEPCRLVSWLDVHVAVGVVWCGVVWWCGVRMDAIVVERS